MLHRAGNSLWSQEHQPTRKQSVFRRDECLSHTFPTKPKFHLPQASTAYTRWKLLFSCCSPPPALLLPVKVSGLLLCLMGADLGLTASWRESAGFTPSTDGYIQHFCCISAWWSGGRFFLDFITSGEIFSISWPQVFEVLCYFGRAPDVTAMHRAVLNFSFCFSLIGFRSWSEFHFSLALFFSGAPFGESALPGQRTQLHCWCLLSSLLLLLDMVFSE